MAKDRFVKKPNPLPEKILKQMAKKGKNVAKNNIAVAAQTSSKIPQNGLNDIWSAPPKP